jgi:hypothetical protein
VLLFVCWQVYGLALSQSDEAVFSREARSQKSGVFLLRSLTMPVMTEMC